MNTSALFLLAVLALSACSTPEPKSTAAERAQQQLDSVTAEKGKYVLSPVKPTTRIVERTDGTYIE